MKHPEPGPAVEARNARHLRRLNIARVLSVVMERTEPFTRAELTEATALSTPTVGTVAQTLIREGLIRDLGAGPSRGGRRPAFMEFNARHGFVAGVSMGATRTRIALADLRGERLASRVIPTPGKLPPPVALARLSAEIRSLLDEAGIRRERLLAVAAGAPAAVDRDRGIVIALAPYLRGWSDVPMARILSDDLGAPTVVENDVNLAVLGERWRGAAHGHETCAFVHAGSGIGAGIVIDGELHRGHHSLAGEIGLMCMAPEHLRRDFGSRGCLETLANLKALAARWPGVGRAERKGWLDALFEGAQNGDGTARKAIDATAALIGIAVTNLSLVLDPSLIVLGGALFEQGGDFAGEVRRIVARVIPSPPALVVSALGNEATLWGSVLVATREARARLRRRLVTTEHAPRPRRVRRRETA